MARTFIAPDPIPSRPDRVPAPNMRLQPAGTRWTLYLRCPPPSGKLPFNRSFAANMSGGAACSCGDRARREKYAENSSTVPNTIAIAWVETRVARNAPNNAPRVVAISKNIPMRMFEKPSLTNAAAAPEEVAITETREAPMAYRMSTLNKRLSSGTNTTPPPSPVNAPTRPARSEQKQTSTLNSRMFMKNLSGPQPCAIFSCFLRKGKSSCRIPVSRFINYHIAPEPQGRDVAVHKNICNPKGGPIISPIGPDV